MIKDMGMDAFGGKSKYLRIVYRDKIVYKLNKI